MFKIKCKCIKCNNYLRKYKNVKKNPQKIAPFYLHNLSLPFQNINQSDVYLSIFKIINLKYRYYTTH